MKLLHIDSSILAVGSVSRTLSADIVAALQESHHDIDTTYRDLAARPIAHLSGAHLSAFQGAEPTDPAMQADIDAGQAALEEFLAADIVVVGSPMYNFTVPSQLKAWIDRIAVKGKTFRYSEKGVEGLAGGKKVIVASSRGGFYGPDTPAAALEHQESYLRGVLGFLGITDVTFIRAEGVGLGTDAREQALQAARSEITKLAA